MKFAQMTTRAVLSVVDIMAAVQLLMPPAAQICNIVARKAMSAAVQTVYTAIHQEKFIPS